MKRQGYTLVEMLVVLAIIALMMAIVVPRFTMSQKGEGLKGAATELTTALRTARRIAITKREVRALALDIYSIPAEFMIMKWDTNKSTWVQDQGVEKHKFTDDNVAVVAVTTVPWPTDGGSPPVSVLDITRTDDDVSTLPSSLLDGAEAYPYPLPSDTGSLFNPQIDAAGNPAHGNSHVNPIYHLIKFQPTGTADAAVIYLWNIEQGRQEIPNPTPAMGVSNISQLGVPPGLLLKNVSRQDQFFYLPNPASSADSYYYTLVVNQITGGVTVYDYAWGTGSGSNSSWDRKKDGES